jgi:hypothetical protein
VGSTDPRGIAADTIAPRQWDIFALWYRLPEDEHKEYEQFCELKAPSGQIVLSGKIAFRMTEAMHRNVISVAGLPVNPGECDLTLYLSEKGAEKDRQALATFPLKVRPPELAPQGE